MDPTTLEIHTRRLKAYKDENGSSADGGEVQTDLFGNDDSAMLEMVKISKAAGELVKENKQKILAVKGVVKRPQVAKEMGVDINDPEAVKAAIAQLEYENQRLMSPTPEPEILHKIKVRAGLETEESQVVETGDKQDEFLKSVIAQDMLVGNVNYSLRPKEIDESVANNVNKVREKIAYIRDNNLPTDTQSIDRICDTEMKPISKLNDKWFNWYKEKFNAKSPYIYTSEAYIVDHHFNHHPNTELSRYLLLPDTIFAPHAVKDVSTKRGPSQAFIKKYDNWVLSTLKPNLDVDENGRIILFKNFLRDKKKSMPYKNKKDINVEEFSREDAIPPIVRDLDNSKSTAGTRQLVSGRLENSLQIQSYNSAQSQGKKSGNVKGGIEAKQVDASPDISEPIDEAAAMQDDSLDLGLAASGGMSPWKNPLRRKFALTVKRKIEPLHRQPKEALFTNEASDNSAQSQGKKSGNVKGGIEAKQVDASPDISEPIDEAAAMQDDSLDLGLAASGGMSPRSLKIREKLKGIFDKIFSEKIPNVMFDFAKVSKRTIDKVLEITSGKVDLSEYKHVISSNSIYHARKGGHFEGNNFSDSLPLTKEDLLRVGDVVENWDDITFRKRKNADTITYQKAYPDGTILYVEEILNGGAHGGAKRLASKTIYKRKSEVSADTAEASRYTSETTKAPHSSGLQSDNSAQSQGKKSGNVKGGIEAKQVDASADISEPIDVAEADYRKISEIAQKEFKAKPALLSRVISKSRSILPRTVKFDKSKNRLAGVPSIADIRRYAERAFAVPIAAKMRRDNPKFLGVYLSDLQAIRTRGGHTNDIGLLAHELGHHLETILFAGKLSEAETAAARELAAYCVERFGDNAYPQNEHVSEGFAQFISDVLTDVNDARARCPQAYALLERALRDNSNAAAVFDNIAKWSR